MPSSVNVVPRKLFKEDLQLTTSPSAATSNQNVLGVVGVVPLNPIDAVLYSAFTQAANDTAAQTAGVGLGEIYYNTTSSKLKARLT